MAQYNFSEDWDQFFDKLDSYLDNRQNFEKEYNSICRKAKNQEYDNPNSSACYYYMAAVLCYLYYDNPDTSSDETDRIVEMGGFAIKAALDLLHEDEEFLVLSLAFEVLELIQKIDDAKETPKFIFKKLHSIEQICPPIESIENTLIKNEALRKWFNEAYDDVLYNLLVQKNMELDLGFKVECASELKSSSSIANQLVAYAYLADALFNMGNYAEAQRYAVLGKDILGSISEYNNDDFGDFYWGMCWSIYARCQEEAGDIDFAITLLEKGAALGIPWCKKEIERLQVEGYYGNNVVEDAVDEQKKSSEDVSYAKNDRKSEITSNEQEYLDMVKDCVEDGEIGTRERKLLDIIRVKNGISEERARELESTLTIPQLTQDELEYLETYQEYAEKGEITEKERRRLDKFAKALGLTERRIQELEVI